jgi:hypothetical protein
MIEENVGNPIANQKKALRVKLFQDTNTEEQFEHIYSSLK